MAKELSCRDFLLKLIDPKKSKTVSGNRKYLNNIKLINEASQEQIDCLLDVITKIKSYPLFSRDRYKKEIRNLKYSQAFSKDLKLVKAALCCNFKLISMLIPRYLELQACLELNEVLAGT